VDGRLRGRHPAGAGAGTIPASRPDHHGRGAAPGLIREPVRGDDGEPRRLCVRGRRREPLVEDDRARRAVRTGQAGEQRRCARSRNVRFTQPSPSTGTNTAVFTISARPYDVDQTCETADSSVSARARPLAARTTTATSAVLEKRRTAAPRTPSSRLASGTT